MILSHVWPFPFWSQNVCSLRNSFCQLLESSQLFLINIFLSFRILVPFLNMRLIVSKFDSKSLRNILPLVLIIKYDLVTLRKAFNHQTCLLAFILSSFGLISSCLIHIFVSEYLDNSYE